MEHLNLNWREKDLPQRKRTKHVHGLHPYLGKFIPQLPEIFLRKYFEHGQTILDPFAGSGTTLVQANELGINSIGCDISAFNALLCKVKTDKYDIQIAKQEVQDILQKTKETIQPRVKQLSFFTKPTEVYTIPTHVTNEYLGNWYAPQAFSELMIYCNLIQSENYQYQNLLKIILTRAARSARLTTHFDLDFPKHPQKEPYWCYKHRRTCSPTQEALKFLKRYSTDTLRRIEDFMQIRTDASVSIYHQDSRKLNIDEIDGIITSPPYVGLIDYHEQHIYAYHLLDLEDKRIDEIGPAQNGSSKKAQKKYQEGISEVFRAVTKKLSSGSRIIVVAGDRHNLYDEIAQMSNLEIEDIVKRHVNRRTGRRATEFYESIFIWRKP
ncbi:DNA methyltransferase [Anaerolineales bacterium HSG25]|nr:DNA methyltransferase [Anaerolineales bacterium HSG25]